MKSRSLVGASILCASGLLVSTPARADGGAAHRAAQTIPVKLGTSGGNVKDASKAFCCSGTLGALVRKADGKNYVLSNNHVLARSDAALPGEGVSQPGLIDSQCRPKTTVALYSQTAPLGSKNVDAALAEVTQGRVDSTGAILDIGIPASTTAIAAVGMKVAKSGRTTGLTCGNVTSVLTDVSVQYQKGCNSGKKFTVAFSDQVVIGSSTFSAGGDSGSLIVNAATAQPVALLFAGSSTTTIGNPIQDVVTALGVSFVGGATHAVACPGTAGAATSPVATLPAQAIERAAAVKNRHGKGLMRKAGIQGVGIGASDDDPAQAALVVYLTAGMDHAPLPAEFDGIPTKVVSSERFEATGWNETSGGRCQR